MPIFTVQTFKGYGLAKPWTNRWYTDQINLSEATAAALDIVDFEQLIHATSVSFTSVRISSVDPLDPAFNTVPLIDMGERATSTDAMPRFNTFRLILGVFGSRPSLKYFRGPVFEGDQNDGLLTPAALTFLNGAPLTALNDLIVAGTICDESGNQFTQSNWDTAVRERQLTRRRRTPAPAVP